jgi:hypothetical protein
VVRDHYRAARPDPGEAHPVDTIVARLPGHARLRRQIHRLSERLIEQLGAQSQRWIELESLINRVHTEREEAHYNLGYAHGLVAGRISARQQLVPGRRRGGNGIMKALRTAVLNAGMPTPAMVAALLEIAWALVLGLPPPHARQVVKKQHRHPRPRSRK